MSGGSKDGILVFIASESNVEARWWNYPQGCSSRDMISRITSSVGRMSSRRYLEGNVMGGVFVPLFETIAMEGSDVIWMVW